MERLNPEQVLVDCCKDISIKGALLPWLNTQAAGMEYLLAQTLTGVVWGKVVGNALVLQPEAEPLTEATMLEVRLFGKEKELLVWRDGGKLHGRVWTHKPHVDSYEQTYILWGTAGRAEGEGFTKVVDGQQGLSHTVPLPFSQIRFTQEKDKEGLRRPLGLTVRHTLAADTDTGLTVIVASCLTGLSNS